MGSLARRGDFWSGLALAALGAYIVSQARGWVYMGEDGPGAGFFPLWYGTAMLALSLALVASAALKRTPIAERKESAWQDLGRAGACWLAFVACIALMRLVGFAVAFALLTWFIVAVMAKQRQRTAWSLAIGGALVFELLFSYALDVTLPRGIWF